MNFAVVGCPRCRRVQVIETRTMNSRCRGCDLAFAWHERKLFYHGDDAAEARRVAAKVGLQVAGAGIVAVTESAAAFEKERSASIQDVVTVLDRSPEFDEADVQRALTDANLPWTADRVVQYLRSQHRLFEPRPGRFRWIR